MIRQYKKGSIVPRWLLKAPRKHTHKVTFGTDVKVIPIKFMDYPGSWANADFICGYEIQGNLVENESAIHVKGMKNLQLIGCPYNSLGGCIQITNTYIGMQITNTRALKPVLSCGSPE